MTDPKPPVGDTPTGRAGDRIAKLLARAGIASRRDIERMIGEGRIALNGVTLDTPATILTTLDGITVDGHPVAAPPPAQLFLYHKPPGLLVTEHDPAGRPIIYDLLPRDLPRVVPVGRLDLNTEGLLLLTTDGGFKRQLELPATGVERTYRARAYGDITQAQLEELIEGIEIEGMRYGPIDANLERRTGANVWIEMTLTEGKNREVRRVLEHLGLQVSRLIRTRYGPFVLGDLAPGEVGEVRGQDIGAFRRTLDGPRRTREPMAPVEVEARAKAPVATPAPPPALRPEAQVRRPRPAPASAPARPAATTGWGSRTRPSRPHDTNGKPPVDRTRPDRPRGDAPRPDRLAAERRGAVQEPRQGGGRSDRPNRTAPGGRPSGTGFRTESPGAAPRRDADRASPRAERSRTFRDHRDADGAPARPVGDRPRTGAPSRGRDDRHAGPPRGSAPNRPGGKGPAGGRGHPPRAPKGKR